jgi:hypothetical protein
MEKNATPLEATRKAVTAGILSEGISTMDAKALTIVGNSANPLAAKSSSLGV